LQLKSNSIQNATVRNFAVESLTAIIHNTLAHTISNPLPTLQDPTLEASLPKLTEKALPREDDTKHYPQTLDGQWLSKQELYVDAMQVKMLEALTELSKNNHNDVKDKTLTAVVALLQSSGQTLNSGYNYLLHS
jgi:hypothetical protein